jgi:hypothetical protein
MLMLRSDSSFVLLFWIVEKLMSQLQLYDAVLGKNIFVIRDPLHVCIPKFSEEWISKKEQEKTVALHSPCKGKGKAVLQCTYGDAEV